MEIQLEQARQTFIQESRELLQAMESELLRAEAGENDAESINSLFRSAHTIKGSAGLFGLDAIVEFTHVVESVLDQVREGETALDPELADVLLACADHIGRLIDTVAQGGNAPEPALAQSGQTLRERLSAYLHATLATTEVAQAAPAAAVRPAAAPGAGAQATAGTWHISLRFGPDMFRHGMDPLSFVAYLAEVGEIKHVTTITDTIPSIASIDPETCHLGFEIELQSDRSKSDIEAVFEFAREDCDIRILHPHSQLAEYARLIAALPEDDMRLGEILVKSGALTRAEVDEALAAQSVGDGPKPLLGEVIVEKGLADEVLVNAAIDRQQRGQEKRATETKFLKVPADRLDGLINLVGELVIAGATTAALAARDRNGVMIEATAVVSRLVEEIRDSALRMRMVAIGETFQRFPRVVRDVARELGKDIELKISGADTELDKSIVEHLADPLMHMVRNAIDHGIESPARREASGKPARGVLSLNAYHDSGSIVVEVGDDGGGLDRERIRAKAIERGLLSPEQTVTEQDLFNLIFEPGFSTASQVTNLSGRGVGMDVVKRGIEGLRGTIEVTSEMGVGTTVRVRLPLTLAIIDGFLVAVGKRYYVVPLDMVIECVELSAEERENGQGRHYVDLRGKALPFVRLRETFELDEAPAGRENIVVVEFAGMRAGLVVDTLHGELQTVIKPLSKLFRDIRGISGSTILGTGEVALILDVPTLIGKQMRSQGKERAVSGVASQSKA